MAITLNNENQWKEITKLLTVQNSNDFKQNLYSKKKKKESNSMQWILKHAWVKKVDQLFTYDESQKGMSSNTNGTMLVAITNLCTCSSSSDMIAG